MNTPTGGPQALSLPHGKLTAHQMIEWRERLEATALERNLFRQERRFLVALRRAAKSKRRSTAPFEFARIERERKRKQSKSAKRGRAFRRTRMVHAPEGLDVAAIARIASRIQEAHS